MLQQTSAMGAPVPTLKDPLLVLHVQRVMTEPAAKMVWNYYILIDCIEPDCCEANSNYQEANILNLYNNE